MVRLDIDLAFSESEQGADADIPPFEGTITAAGSEIRIVVSDPSRLPGNGRRTLAELSTVADALASRGISVQLEGPDGPILQLGEVKSNPLQRAITGSKHIRLGSVSAVAPLMTRRNKGQALTFPIPPETPLPLVPTINRTVRRRITTTHYTPGSGRPRLIFAVGDSTWDGSRPREFDLLPTKTTIGSGSDVDLQLPGLAPLHAEIRHEGDDEYVLYGFDQVGGGGAREQGPGRDRGGRILRTGARIELGDWRLAYFRAEFADHGRPYGGRQGGELSDQRKQPPRGGTGPLSRATDPE
ncbi:MULTISPECIES: FHA domain-containing protein [Microbacterium]|uniref:FHA domain-containing protein n=1 Tax=Microbacterium algihabitans TaxID=3075992 RepID=A0ABU3RVD2_9MICO|nr:MULTISPECIES: FHA domain-containing protein [Microbacterium]MDU0326540.1 FHA domain-containing protein [Microbacterium sp. KSW2-21]